MKRIGLAIILSVLGSVAWAQTAFKGDFENKQEGLNLTLNLQEETIYVPGMSFIGATHGYLSGNLYGIWIITSVQIKDESHATIHLSNDQGADTQVVGLTLEGDSLLSFEAKGRMLIKRVEKKKLAKLSSTIKFYRR